MAKTLKGAYLMRYAIVVEHAGRNYGAYVPNLPGCVATGATVAEVERSIRDAIEMYLEGMIERWLADTGTDERGRICGSWGVTL